MSAEFLTSLEESYYGIPAGVYQQFPEFAAQVEAIIEENITLKAEASQDQEERAALGRLAIKFREDSLTDPVTKILNYRGLEDCYDRMIATPHRRSTDTSQQDGILFGDIDHFRKLNDQLSFTVANGVLSTVAQKLQSSLPRKTDVVGRWGGDEFVVLLPGAGQQKTVELAELLRQNIAELEISVPSGLQRVTMTFGADIIDSTLSFNDAHTRAGVAMKKGKKVLRNAVYVVDDWS
jgi:diguanylate cyclase (GGDEF)-like protein